MKDIFRYFDKFSFAILILITLSGVVLIYSASYNLKTPYHSKQLLWLFFSLIAFFIVFRIKIENIFRAGFGLYYCLVFLLFLQLVAGKVISGTKSWIELGFFNVQISEFIKVVLALCLAKYLTKFSKINWRSFIKLLIYIGIPLVLIGLQPDMGTAFVLSFFLIIIIILKGIKPSIVFFSVILIAVFSFVTLNYVLKPYQKERLISFLNPQRYKDSSGYQVIQSKIAVGSGGLVGKGFLNGSQSQYKFLPTRHTDFIVSVLGEEFGFIGICFIFLLFFILFYRQYNFKAQTDEEYYFVYLFNGIIFFQFLINVLMTIGLVPVLGIPLPFVSYGGSSLLAFFIGEALIFRVKINNFIQ